MFYIFLILIIAFALAKIRRLVTALNFIGEARTLHFERPIDHLPIRYTLLVPCLNESENVLGFINCFRGLEDNENARLVFAISGNDLNVQNLNQATAKQSTDIQFINVPTPFSANKASQLNWVIRTYGISDINHYFVIYDADSRPDRNTLQVATSQILKQKSPLIMQQPTLYDHHGGILNLAEGLFQSMWSFHYEIYYYLKNLGKKGVVHMTYLVGHGLFIRSDFLLAHPLPEKVVEDITFGYDIASKRIPASLLSAFDHADTPNDFFSYVSQKTRWYKGSIYGLLSIKVDSFFKLKMFLTRAVWDFHWLAFNLLVTILALLTFHDITTALLMITIFIMLYYFIPLWIFCLTIKRNDLVDALDISPLKLVVVSFIYFFLYNLGPILGTLSYRKSKA